MTVSLIGDISVEEIHVRGNRRMGREDYDVLRDVVAEHTPATILEIGGADGCSTMTLGLAAKRYGGHVWTIEPYPTARWKRNVEDLELRETVTLIHGPSPLAGLADVPDVVDFLQIDGDHRTRWILGDYHVWERRVPIGGLIGFHDWCGGKSVASWVRRAVAIILEDGCLEEVARSEASGYGEIVFRKLRDPAPCPQWPGEPLRWKDRPTGR